jgi:hypothetical protein
MIKPHLRLAYRQVIDSSSTEEIELAIFNDTHAEFLMQIQSWQTSPEQENWIDFQETIEDFEEKMNFKVGMAIGGYVQKLFHEIPGLADASGRPVLFDNYKFEIVDTNIKSRSAHKVALTYYTCIYTLLEIVGDNLLLMDGHFIPFTGPVETVLIKLIPGLAISSYEIPSQTFNHLT